jgi:hypothetical protein
MSHQHFCYVASHYWQCGGTAQRGADAEPSVCECVCGLPLEGFDHSGCHDNVELLACPKHREEEHRKMEDAKREYDRQRAEFGFDEKWTAMKALPDGAEKHALAQEIVQWLFR